MNKNIRINFLQHSLVRQNKTISMRILITYYLALVFTVFLVTQFDHLFLRESFYSYQEGDVIVEDVILEKALSFINQEASEKKMSLAMDLILPVYVVRDDISKRILDNFEEFRIRISGKVSEQEFSHLISSLENRYPGIQYLEHLWKLDPVLLNLLLSGVSDSLETILDRGMISHLNESQAGVTGLIEVVHSDTGQKKSQLVETVILMDNWQETVREDLERYDFSQGEAKFIEMIVYYFLEPNCFFSKELTDLKKQELVKTMTDVWIHMNEGETLLHKGTVVSSLDMAKIKAYIEARGRIRVSLVVAPFLYVLLIFILAIILLIAFPDAAGLLENPHLLFFLSWFHLTGTLLLFRFLSFSQELSPVLFMPTGLVCIVLSMLRNRRETIIFALLQAVLIFFVLDFNAPALYMTLFTGLGSCLVIEGAEKRIDLIKGGMFLAFVETGLMAIMLLVIPVSPGTALLSLAIAFVNGMVSGFLSLMVLPLFEHILNPCTTFRLQELSDLNTPIIKRMLALAPGSYSHSQNVANLAETGCRNIGANALLARVGAYYHDIGKIDQSKYFSENQMDHNKHNDMKTSLSVAVIKSHVKIGVEMARKLGLPEAVISIIAQHHGTSVIEYFYQQAVKEKGMENVSLEDYSHSGPKPQTREAAVVMLADMAEAATKSMVKPTVNKLERFLWDLIMARFKDGELNECGMTLKDLERVKSSFVHVLTGQYHTRIEYPDRAKRNNNGGT